MAFDLTPFTRRLIDLLLEEPSTFVYVVDLETQRFVYANETSSELLGYRPYELLDQSAPDMSRCFRATRDDAEATLGRTRTLRHRDGSERWLRTHEATLKDKKGAPLLIGFGYDITLHREVSSDLGLHKFLLRTVNRIASDFSNHPLGDPIDETIEEALSVLGSNVGASRCHLCRIEDRAALPIKLTMLQEWHEDGLAGAVDELQNIPVDLFPWFFERLDKGLPVALSTSQKLPGSDWVLQRLLNFMSANRYLALPLVDGQETWGYFGFAFPNNESQLVDPDVISLLTLVGQVFVNRIKAAESNQRVLDSEKRWRQTASFAFDLVLICDSEGIIRDVDTHREDIDSDRMVGASIYQIVDPDFGRSLRDAITQAVETPSLPGGYVNIEIQALGPDNKLVWYEFRVCAFVETGEITLNVFGTLIEEHKRSLATIAELTKELDRAAHASAVGQIATDLAHEMKQPLQVIMSYAAAMRTRALGTSDDMLEEAMREIEDAAKSANNVIQQVRESAAGRIVAPEYVDVCEITRTAMLYIEPTAREAGALIECRVVPGVAGVFANRTHVAQVLTNLMLNGIQAGSEMIMADRVRVTVDVQLSTDGRFVEFIVADNGPGVPTSQRETIFERFESSKPLGMGVGLAIGRKITEQHGGTLTLLPKSHMRRGAAFLVRLPACDAEDDATGL